MTKCVVCKKPAKFPMGCGHDTCGNQDCYESCC